MRKSANRKKVEATENGMYVKSKSMAQMRDIAFGQNMINEINKIINKTTDTNITALTISEAEKKRLRKLAKRINK